jgi:hypothetical protein
MKASKRDRISFAGRLILSAGLLWAAQRGPGATLRTVDGKSLVGRVTLTKESKITLESTNGPIQVFDLESIEEVVFPNRVQAPSAGAVFSNAWTGCDIGVVDQPGKMEMGAEGRISLRDGGRGLGGKKGDSDSCYFVHQQVQGNFELVARVRPIEEGRLARAGLMMRQDLESDSAFVMVARTVGDRSTTFTRMETGGRMVKGEDGEFAILGATWLKLAQQDHAFIASQSPDGKTWMKLGEASLLIPEDAAVQVGLAAASALAAGEPGRSTFDQVELSIRPLSDAAAWTPPGVVGRDGSVLAGEVVSADERTVVFKRGTGAGQSLPVAELAALSFVSLSPPSQEKLKQAQSGVVLLEGSLVAGEFKGLERDEAVVSSVLFGRQRFTRKTKAAAVLFRPWSAAKCLFEVELADRSRLRARSLAWPAGHVIIRTSALGTIEVSPAELVRIHRAGQD